jgi:hypothetical protein
MIDNSMKSTVNLSRLLPTKRVVKFRKSIFLFDGNLLTARVKSRCLRGMMTDTKQKLIKMSVNKSLKPDAFSQVR